MKKRILPIFLAFLYSIFYVVVGPNIEAQSTSLGAMKIFAFLVCFLLCSAINIFLFSSVPKWRFELREGRITRWINKQGDRKLFLLVWAFIFVSWVPAYLILYPGVISYDMVSQVESALGTITTNHHPVLHTWLIRVFMNLGESLFSGYEYGLGVLAILQMVVLSYALARLVLLLKKKNVPILIVSVTALFSAIWFMNACLAVTMIKDTLHAAFLVLFVCHFVEIVLNPLEYIQKKRNLVIFPIVVFFMCAFRNNGIHIYLFCIAGLLVLRIAQIKKVKVFIPLIVAMLLPVLLFKIYTGPVFEALEIEQGDVREALCIPIQQLQRVAVKRAGELTSEQTEQMLYYITDLAWREWSPGRQYDPFFADPAKSCFISVHYNEDPAAFWKFYLQTGMQFSKEYITAFLSNTLGYWYPGYYKYSEVMYENYPPEMFVVPLERKSIGNWGFLETIYKELCSSELLRQIPVLRLYIIPAFSPWILLYALIFAWKKKGYFTRVFPLFLPLIAQFGIMLLSPMSSFRYSWPFYLMLPLAFIGIWGNTELAKSEEKGAETQEGMEE